MYSINREGQHGAWGKCAWDRGLEGGVMEVKADGTWAYIKQRCLALVSAPLGIELLTSIVFFQFKEKYSPVICAAIWMKGFRWLHLDIQYPRLCHTCLSSSVWAHFHPKLSKVFKHMGSGLPKTWPKIWLYVGLTTWTSINLSVVLMHACKCFLMELHTCPQLMLNAALWVRTSSVRTVVILDQNLYVYTICLQWWRRPYRGVFTGCQRWPVDFPEPVLVSLVKTYLSYAGCC